LRALWRFFLWYTDRYTDLIEMLFGRHVMPYGVLCVVTIFAVLCVATFYLYKKKKYILASTVALVALFEFPVPLARLIVVAWRISKYGK
jgi:hypothetical protein